MARILIAVAALEFAAPSAFARGALTLNQDVCLLFVGPDFMYFAGYDPAKPRKRFCEDVPHTGDTVFTMDFAQDDMRAMKVDFRIIREIGDADDAAEIEKATLAHLPPKVYPAGSLSLRYDFKEAGNYAGIVTVDGPDNEHWVARFPFAVGRPYPALLPYYLLFAALILALIVMAVGREDKSKPKLEKRR
jgi:hypothetical protein